MGGRRACEVPGCDAPRTVGADVCEEHLQKQRIENLYVCEHCGSIEGTPHERTCPLREVINHPQHYGGDTTYEAIKVIEAWELGFCLGNAVKYISRAGKKNPAKECEDLEKARWYLERRIQQLS